MKIKYLKLVTLIIIVGLLSTLILGCAGNTSADKGLTGLGLPEAKDLKEVTLTFYLLGPSGMRFEAEKVDAQKVLREIEKRAKATLNVKLDFKWLADWEYFSEVKSLLNNGGVIDGFYYINPTPDWDFEDEVNAGKIMDISKLLPQYAPKIYKTYTNQELEAAKINGKLLTVPKLYQPVQF